MKLDAPAASSLTMKLVVLLRRQVSEEARRRAALHVLDWGGCAVSGAASPAATALLPTARATGHGDCTAVTGGQKGLSAAAAAFFNGGLGNVLEMDDIHRTSILHPGSVVIPAALAAAQSTGATPEQFLNAIVRGYEAVIRIGMSVGPSHYALWHNTSTCGPFGAAAAVAGLLGLSDEATVWALGNAGTQSSGMWRCRHEPVMSKQLHTARAAQSGLLAADLAARGFSGAAFILEGDQGFYETMAPDAMPSVVLAGPEGDWKIWDTSFKPWPACRHTHPAIDAALALKESGVRADDIRALTVQTYGDAAKFCDRTTPTTELQAKFSLQHSVAVTLLDGPPNLDAFRADALTRSDIAKLRETASVSVEPRYDEAYPYHYGSGLVATLRDGETTFHTPDALGDPNNPVANDRLIEKVRMLCRYARLPSAATDDIIASALALPNGNDDDLNLFCQALSHPPTEDSK